MKLIAGIGRALERLGQKMQGRVEGTLPNAKWLNENGYAGLRHAMAKHPEMFKHIGARKQQQKSPQDWVAVAERLAAQNGGRLPTIN